MTVHRPSDSVPSRATPADTASSRVTLADTASSRAAPANTALRLLIAVGPGVDTSSALSSVSDAITRLQRERDLALRRIDELHVHYKKELISGK
jgi:hypothetical protein